jgi:N-acetylglucosaminyl-diphospho-decaprenol L-rhamnosyltransferase
MSRPLAVIVHWGAPAGTLRLVDDLVAPPRGFDVAVVANETPASASWLAGVRMRGATVVTRARNRGYAGGLNDIVRALPDRPGYLVLNNDVRCSVRAAQALLDRALDDGVAAAAPLSYRPDGSVESMGVDVRPSSPYLVEHRSTPTAREPFEVDAVQGSAMAMAGRALAELGPWDECFFYGWEETDYCMRARARGLRVVVDPAIVVLHEGTASLGGPHGYGVIVEYMLIRNLLHFCERWLPDRLNAHRRHWLDQAGLTSIRDPGVVPADPKLARVVTLRAVEAFERGEIGVWPASIDALARRTASATGSKG